MSKTFEVIEFDAVDSPVKDIKWYGKEDRTEDTSIHDRGKGTPVNIRHLEFALKPGMEVKSTREQILTPEYMRFLQTELWADDLRMVLEPRIEIKENTLHIFVPCVSRTGSNFTEDPKLLQEWIR